MAGKVDRLVRRARYWTEEANLGYDQTDRWDIRPGGECDCTSLTYWCVWEADLMVRPADYRTRTLYSGTIADDLVAAGWKKLAPSISALQPGDVLVSTYHHAAICVAGFGWGAYLAEANIDERGRTTGGQPGDQTDRETRVINVYEYSAGWDWILRPPTDDLPQPMPSDRIDEDGWLGPQTIGAWQDALGTAHDSVVSGQCRDLAWRFPALLSVEYERSGSVMVMEIQRRLGIDRDGVIGYDTVTALQKQLLEWGYDLGTWGVDHVLGRATGKAIQKSINDGRWG